MAHVWQQAYGKPLDPRLSQPAMGREDDGDMLASSTTGQPGGKETGQHMSHYIIPEGPYAKAYAKLKATGLQLHWESAPQRAQAKVKNASKTKFTCPECGQNA